MLQAIEENKRIRALVVDIDSPGRRRGRVGEPVPGDPAHRRSKKPVVAFVQRHRRLGRVHGGVRRDAHDGAADGDRRVDRRDLDAADTCTICWKRSACGWT